MRFAVPSCTVFLTFFVLTLTGCDSSSNEGANTRFGFNLDNCTIPTDKLVDGTGGRGRDAIPLLSNPKLVSPDAEGASYLAGTDRVIGVLLNGQAFAVPHNILWFHEIANFDNLQGQSIAITYCPLTGSSLGFDRRPVDGATLGVSGLLLRNNLVMYDRNDKESLWPQMNRKAGCGPEVGESLPMIPVVEMSWSHWTGLHPNTKVVSSETGYARRYTADAYPYPDNYENPQNGRLLFDMSIDRRRPPKERVLGIPVGDDKGLAIPFETLSNGSEARAVEVTVGGEMVIVFWVQEARGAMAYRRPRIDGQSLSFSVDGGKIVDNETGSTWALDGTAIDGPHDGDRLEPVDRAYVAFWFAWAAFHPETEIWGNN